MKKIRICSFLLCISLFASLFSGCFGGENSTDGSSLGGSSQTESSSTSDGSSGDSGSLDDSSGSSGSTDTSEESSESTCAHTYEYDGGACVQPTLTTEGHREVVCSKCGNGDVQQLPMLTQKDYDYTPPQYACTKGIASFSSNEYGVYTAVVEPSELHTHYAGICDTCGVSINNLEYDESQIITVCQDTSAGAYYPRMLKLKNGDFLCAFEHVGAFGSSSVNANRIVVARSKDGGVTWDNATFGSNAMPIASVLPTAAQVPNIVSGAQYNCSNAALYQMENGDLICAYKAASSSDSYGRYIFCSISKDNGYTWSYHSEISNCWKRGSASAVKSTINKSSGVGVHEPIFGDINGDLVVMYADDFWPMFDNVKGSTNLNHETQYLVEKTWDGSSWANERIVQNGSVSKTVASGVTNHSRDGMPGFAALSNGSYVMVMEGTYRRTQGHPFVILMSYSKDGENWSTPIEIYKPHTSGAKAAAPYVTVTKDDRIVVSFQTDEDSVKAGTGTGDWYSVMKTIVSDGTPVDKITGRGNFYSAESVFNTSNGLASVWPSNYYDKDTDTVYCAAGVNFAKKATQTTIYMQKVKIAASEINAVTKETALSSEYTVKKGGFAATSVEGFIKSTQEKSLLLATDKTVYNGSISVDVIPSTANDCGLIFRASSSSAGEMWENKTDSYYLFILNWNGCWLLGRWAGESGWGTIAEVAVEDFNPAKPYRLKVEFQGTQIDCYLNNEKVYSHTDTLGLTGGGYGLRTNASGVWFGNLSGVSA